MKKIATIFLVFLLSESAIADYCDGKIEYLKLIINSNAVDDANKSLSIGDDRYLATYGYTYMIPGISNEESNRVRKESHFVPIEGSGDNLCTWPGAPRNLFDKIHKYAELYNQTIHNAK